MITRPQEQDFMVKETLTFVGFQVRRLNRLRLKTKGISFRFNKQGIEKWYIAKHSPFKGLILLIAMPLFKTGTSCKDCLICIAKYLIYYTVYFGLGAGHPIIPVRCLVNPFIALAAVFSYNLI